jgi:spermidine synthase
MGIDAGRLEALEPACGYYNGALHRAAFALPTFLKRIVGG